MAGDAKVKIGADASEIERAMGAAMKTVNNAGKQFKQEFNEAARSIVNDFAHIALAGAKVNFAAQHEQVLAFEKSVSKMSVASGQSFDQVRESAMQTGLAIGRQPNEVLKWTSSVQRLTYSFKDTNATMVAMSNLALKTGRDVESFSGLAVQFGKMGVEGAGVNTVLSTMEAQAKAAGIPLAALVDMFSAAGDSIGSFSDKGGNGLTRMSGLMANIAASSGNLFVANKASGQLTSMLQSDPLKYERILGRKITTGKGQVENMGQVLYDVTARGAARHGGVESNEFRKFMIQSRGLEAGEASINMLREAQKRPAGQRSFSVADVATLSAAEKKSAQDAYAATPGGQRDAAQVKLFASSDKLMNSSTALGKAAHALESFAANNPIAATIAGTVGGGVINAGSGKLGGTAWNLAKGVLTKAVPSAAVAAGGATAAAITGAIVGGLVIGGAVGTGLDYLPRVFGGKNISSYLSGTDRSIKEEEDKKDLEASGRGDRGYKNQVELTKAIEKAKFNVVVQFPGETPETVANKNNRGGKGGS